MSTDATASAQAGGSSTVDASLSAITILAARAANKDPLLSEKRKAFNDSKSKLKVDIKKATAFGKKMRTFTSEQEKGILNDLDTISVGMFVKEAAQGVGPAVWEGKMKLSDAVPFVNCISAIHQRYDSFLSEALQGLQAGFATHLTTLLEECNAKLDMVNGSIADLTRLRVAVRVMCELYLQGLVQTPKFFIAILAKMCQALDAPASGANSKTAGPAHVTINVLTIVGIILRSVGFELTHLGFAGIGGCSLSFNENGIADKTIEEEGKKAGADASIAKATGFTHIELISKKTRDDASAKLLAKKESQYASIMMASESDRDEFQKRVVRITEQAVALCNRLKKEVENKWRQLCELTELAGEIAAEKRELFASFKRETERFIVLTENIASMMDFPQNPEEAAGQHQHKEEEGPDGDGTTAAQKKKAVAVVLLRPTPIDLLGALKNSNVDQSVVLVASSMAEFFNVRNAESVNHYDTVEQREFYENLLEVDELTAILPAGIPTRIVPKPSGKSSTSNNNNYNNNDDYYDYDEEEKDEDAISKDDEEPVPITIFAAVVVVGEGGATSQDASVLSPNASVSALTAIVGACGASSSSNSTNNVAVKAGGGGGGPAAPATMKIVATYDVINEHLALVYNLPTAEAADQWVKTFLFESCKYFKQAVNIYGGALLFFNGCRRKLQKAMRSLGRCNHDTIPMVGRVVATLSKVIDELGDVLAKKLEGELQFAVQKRSSAAYMRKMRSTRYLCELVKFRVAAPLSVIKLFQQALKEIDNPHSVEIILILISNVTSFLLRGGMTRVRAEEYLKELKEVRITKGAAIGSGQESMLEQAIAELNEAMTADRNASLPEGASSAKRLAAQIRKRSPLEHYFRYLLFTNLTEETLEEVCQSIRLMPWTCEQGVGSNRTEKKSDTEEDDLLNPKASANGEKHYDMLIRVFRKTHQCRWDRLHVLAEALADTCDVYPSVGAAVTDTILEDIRTDLTVTSSAHHKALREAAIDSIRSFCRHHIAAAAEAGSSAAPEVISAANKAAATLTTLESFLNFAEQGSVQAGSSVIASSSTGGAGVVPLPTTTSASSPASGAPAVSSSLAKYMARSAEPTRSSNSLYAPALTARSNQKMLVDLKFVCELYNQRILTFRAIGYILAELCCFYPNPESGPNAPRSLANAASNFNGSASAGSSSSSSQASSFPLAPYFNNGGSTLLSEEQRRRLSPNAKTSAGAQLFNYYVMNTNPVDYSRIRFICGLLDNFIPYVSVGTSTTTTLSAGEKLVLERFMARFFLLIHSKAKPFPMDLDNKLAETMKLVADALYPYPDGYEYLRTGERGPSQAKKISDVPEDQLANFQLYLDRVTEKQIKHNYSKKEWRNKSSSQRRAIKKEVQKAFLKAGDYSSFPKPSTNSKKNNNTKTNANRSDANNRYGVIPYAVIGRLLLDAVGKRRHEETYAEIIAAAASEASSTSSTSSRAAAAALLSKEKIGDEIKESFGLSRPFYFPRTRAEAEAHYDFMAQQGARGGSSSSATTPARLAPGHAVLAKIPILPPQQKGFTLSKAKTKYYEDQRMLALTAIPSALPLASAARESYWFEAVCEGLCSAATNGGVVYSVLGGGGKSSSTGRSGAAAATTAFSVGAKNSLLSSSSSFLLSSPTATKNASLMTSSASPQQQSLDAQGEEDSEGADAEISGKEERAAIGALSATTATTAKSRSKPSNKRGQDNAIVAPRTVPLEAKMVGGPAGGRSRRNKSGKVAEEEDGGEDEETNISKATALVAKSDHGDDDDDDDESFDDEDSLDTDSSSSSSEEEDSENSSSSDSDDDDDDDDDDEESDEEEDDDDDEEEDDDIDIDIAGSVSSSVDGEDDDDDEEDEDEEDDDDDDDFDDRRYDSDDDDEAYYRGPAIGPQAFGLKNISVSGTMASSSSSSSALNASNSSSAQFMMAGGAFGRNLKLEEEAELDRMMTHMLLESTGKALQRETVIDKRLEQRLAGGFYRTVAGKVLTSSPGGGAAATPAPFANSPPPTLRKRLPTVASPTTTTTASSVPPTTTTATPATGATTLIPFALVRRNNKGNADAKPFMIPARSEFAQHVEEEITKGRRDRDVAKQATIILSRKQDEERNEEIRQKQLAQAAAAAAAASSSSAAPNTTHAKEDRIGSYRFSSRR